MEEIPLPAPEAGEVPKSPDTPPGLSAAEAKRNSSLTTTVIGGVVIVALVAGAVVFMLPGKKSAAPYAQATTTPKPATTTTTNKPAKPAATVTTNKPVTPATTAPAATQTVATTTAPAVTPTVATTTVPKVAASPTNLSVTVTTTAPATTPAPAPTAITTTSAPATTMPAAATPTNPSVAAAAATNLEAAEATPATVTNVPAANQPPVLRALWTFEGQRGKVVSDTTSNGFNATLVGYGANWTRVAKVGGSALSLAGGSYAEVADPVVDTTHSFTVAAWVNLLTLNNDDPCQTVLSIDGKEASGFYLQFNRAAGNLFVFNRLESDGPSTATMAKAKDTPSPDKWYHLAGVYDASAKTLALYIDGVLQETVPYNSAWRATGKTAIGRGLYNHKNADFFMGYIDDARIYEGALTAEQIHELATPPSQ